MSLRTIRPALVCALGLTLLSGLCWAESNSLALALDPSTPAGSVSIFVILSSLPGTSPAALQWTVNYSPSDVVALSATVGPAAASAGKKVSCAGPTCVVFGGDNQAIPDGVAAIVTLQLAASPSITVPVQISASLAASPAADPKGVDINSGLVSILTQPPVSNITTGLGYGGSLTHLASGGTWGSTFTLMNTGAAPATTQLDFFGDDGGPLALPVTFPLTSDPDAMLRATQLTQILGPYSIAVADSTGPDSVPTRAGAAQLFKDTSVSGFIRYRSDLTSQEAIVPLEKRVAGAYVLAFDNTNGTATGVAVQNMSADPADIHIVIRDDTGAVTGVTTLTVTGSAHASFLLSDRFVVTVGQSGTVEFDTPSGGLISVLGIRYPPSGHFTTIPVAASSETGQGSLAHLAVGGGWETTLELINLSSQTAQAHVQLYDDSGAALSLPLSISGAASFGSAIDPVIAPNGTVTIVSTNTDVGTAFTGSAQLSSSSGVVSGFIRYRYAPSGQEAIVPLETRNSGAYFLVFDNTGGSTTGVAVANSSAAAANIVVTTRDANGNQIGSQTLNIPANGHSAFILPDIFSETNNLNGTAEFDTPSGGQISVIGIRYPPTGLYTEIPVLTP